MASQSVSQEVTELIIAHLPHEASTITESGHADCHVCRSPTRGFFERGSLGQAHANFRRDKVNEQFTAGDDIHHNSIQERVLLFVQSVFKEA